MSRVLIVEDHKDWRGRLAALLRRQGHSVSIAGDRDRALVRISRPPRVDLAVVDLYIDNDPIGFEICHEAKTLGIPVIGISGPATSGQVSTLFTTGGITDFVPKVPFDEARFILAVNKILYPSQGNVTASVGGSATEASPSVVNILNVIDSRIGRVTQSGPQNPPVAYNLDEIARVLQEMVGIVRSINDLSEERKRDYQLEAEQLKSELTKSRHNLPRVREMLAFLGDIDGTLGLGSRVAPYLVRLAHNIGLMQ